MANFCTKCGKPIDQCICAGRVAPPPQPARAGNFCTKCGKPLAECTCNTVVNPGVDGHNIVKDFFGFSESDVLVKEDCYEIGKKIVPDIIAPGEGEVPIKQYDVGRVRRRSNFSWGYSRFQVTNKRIIQRTVGRSIVGKDVQYQEFAIDDIAGIDFKRGKQFSFGDLLLNLFICAIFGGLGALVGIIEDAGYVLSAILGILVIIAWVYIRFIQRKSSNVLFACMFALSTGATLAGWLVGEEDFPLYVGAVCALLFLVYLIRSCLLPSVSICAKTRVFTGEGARVSAGIRVTNFKLGSIILPGKDTEKALREMGAIINDVQKLGDYAIQKWTEK